MFQVNQTVEILAPYRLLWGTTTGPSPLRPCSRPDGAFAETGEGDGFGKNTCLVCGVVMQYYLPSRVVCRFPTVQWP